MKNIVRSKLKHLLLSIGLFAVASLIFTCTAYAAGTIVSKESTSSPYHSSDGYNSEATDSNGNWASHSTTEWQALGSNASYNNYGVSWKTSNDGGTTWSDSGHDDLFVGQQVQFQFNMYSDNTGIGHLANVLKGWIDWNVTPGSNDSGQNVGGDYEFNPDNVVVTGSNVVRTAYNSEFNNVPGPTNGAGIYQQYSTFMSDVITLDSSHLGTAYLRARVTCTHSLASEHGLGDQWNVSTDTYESVFNAYADYGQGEIEDWVFTVNQSQVPEPATLALFGMGLIGLARIGRKKA